MTRPSREALPTTLMLSRTHPSPAGQMTCTWEPAHVGATFRQQDLRSSSAHPRNAHQEGKLVLKRGQSLRDLLAQGDNLGIQSIDGDQVLGHHELLVAAHPPGQCRGQLLALGPQCPLRQISHRSRVVVSLNQCLQHQARRNPCQITDDTAQLDVGPLERLGQSVDFCAPDPHQTRPVPRQLPPLSLLPRRHKAATQ